MVLFSLKYGFREIVILIIVLALIGSVTAYDTDNIFTDLVQNNNYKTESVFILVNPSSDLDPGDLEFEFTEICGEVVSYEVLAKQQCLVYNQVPIYKNETKCKEVLNNVTESLSEECVTSSVVVGYTLQPSYELGFCKPYLIRSGSNEIMLKANIRWDKCDRGYGYEIDWIPKLDLDGIDYIQHKWAWYNTTYLYRINITIRNTDPNKVLANWSTINFTMDTTGAKFQDDCDDVVITYNASGSDVVLDYDYFDCNKTNTTFKFGLQANISANANSTNQYWLYYGNPTALDPHSNFNLSNVYLFWCDFATDGCGLVETDTSSDLSYNAGSGRYDFSIDRQTNVILADYIGSLQKGANLDGYELRYTWYISSFEPDETNAGTGFASSSATIDALASHTPGADFIWWGSAVEEWTQVRFDSVNVYSNPSWENTLTTGANMYMSAIRLNITGNYTFSYYSDSARTSLIDSKVVKSSSYAHKYLIMLNNYKSGVNNDEVSGWIDDVILFRRIPHNPVIELGSEETAPNNVPTITTPTINPVSVYSFSDLNCSATPTDLENTSLIVDFAWFKNNLAYTIYNTSVSTTNGTLTYSDILVTEILNVSDNWTCAVRSFDGLSYSAWENVTEPVLNSIVTWLQNPGNISFDYTYNVSYDVNATDPDESANQNLLYYINTTFFTIDLNTGLINRTTNVTDIGNYSVRVNVTDNGTGGGYWLNSTFTIQVINHTIPYAPSSVNLELNDLPSIFLFFILLIVWLGLLVIGFVFKNMMFSMVGFLFGVLLGFVFAQIHIFFTLAIVLLNVGGLIQVAIKNK